MEQINTIAAWVEAYERQAATLNDLVEKAEEGRWRRSHDVSVLNLTMDAEGEVVRGLCVGSGGVVYYPRIGMNPRMYNCTCEDKRQRGAEVGPCKHVIRLALQWRDERVIPAQRKLHSLLDGVIAKMTEG